jgi:hypothetical protein
MTEQMLSLGASYEVTDDITLSLAATRSPRRRRPLERGGNPRRLARVRAIRCQKAPWSRVGEASCKPTRRAITTAR